MRLPSKRLAAPAALAAFALTACVPIATRAYFPDPASGAIVYETCTFAPRLPSGVRVERDGVRAMVSLVARGQGGMVEIRFDVPPGRVLVLQDDRVRIDAGGGVPTIRARIPKVSEVDSPLHAYDAPALATFMRPVGAPLEGRERHGVPLHYWVGARFAEAAPDTAWVILPPVTIDGRPAAFPPVRFDRRFTTTFAGNC